MLLTTALAFSLIQTEMARTRVEESLLKVMSYNAENLFDTVHDAGKNDYTYMPLDVKKNDPATQQYCKTLVGFYKQQCLELNWDEPTLKAKMKNLGAVVKASFEGAGPDVLVMEEVENLRVLKMFVNQELKNMGYITVELIEGPDSRGIDVGIISRYPLAQKSKYHLVDLSQAEDGHQTRGILETTIKMGKKQVTIFANHWPSQSNPAANRFRAAEALQKALEKLPTDRLVIATGDFNTNESDKENAIHDVLLASNFSNKFADTGIERCETNGNVGIGGPGTCPPGTHYYATKKSWSYFDRIFLSEAWRTLGVDFTQFKIFSPKFIFQAENGAAVPKRFDPVSKTGYADHLPVVMAIQ